ncbi:hypothetical protein [Agrococcus sp. Ld7]|uniref:hypothetical protein n=1 Tax=Agrococcus sp. Ld7 TaxID=649148 RepID=UPI003866C73A
MAARSPRGETTAAMRRAVHLAGDDVDITAVAAAALRAIGPTHAGWVASVRRLHTERREYMRSLTPSDWREQCIAAIDPNAHDAPAASVPAAPRDAARSPFLTPVWWVLLSIAAVAGTVGALPMMSLRIAQDPALLVAITTPAMVLAAGLLVLTAASMPRAARSGTALGLAASSVILAGAAVALSASRWEAMVAAGDRGSALAWMVGAGVTVLAGCLLAWRAAPRRALHAVEAKPAEGAQRQFAIELMSRARRYVRRVPNDEAVGERWRIELAELAGNVPLESIEQARSLGPWSWLVWAAYDGEIHLPDLLATPR